MPSTTIGTDTSWDIDDPKSTSFGPKSIAHKQEDIRGWLARSLIYILGAEIGVSLVIAMFCPDSAEKMKDLLAVILGPTVALVGSATGFYFGLKRADGDHSK